MPVNGIGQLETETANAPAMENVNFPQSDRPNQPTGLTTEIVTPNSVVCEDGGLQEPPRNENEPNREVRESTRFSTLSSVTPTVTHKGGSGNSGSSGSVTVPSSNLKETKGNPNIPNRPEGASTAKTPFNTPAKSTRKAPPEIIDLSQDLGDQPLPHAPVRPPKREQGGKPPIPRASNPTPMIIDLSQEHEEEERFSTPQTRTKGENHLATRKEPETPPYVYVPKPNIFRPVATSTTNFSVNSISGEKGKNYGENFISNNNVSYRNSQRSTTSSSIRRPFQGYAKQDFSMVNPKRHKAESSQPAAGTALPEEDDIASVEEPKYHGVYPPGAKLNVTDYDEADKSFRKHTYYGIGNRKPNRWERRTVYSGTGSYVDDIMIQAPSGEFSQLPTWLGTHFHATVGDVANVTKFFGILQLTSYAKALAFGKVTPQEHLKTHGVNRYKGTRKMAMELRIALEFLSDHQDSIGTAECLSYEEYMNRRHAVMETMGMQFPHHETLAPHNQDHRLKFVPSPNYHSIPPVSMPSFHSRSNRHSRTGYFPSLPTPIDSHGDPYTQHHDGFQGGYVDRNSQRSSDRTPSRWLGPTAPSPLPHAGSLASRWDQASQPPPGAATTISNNSARRRALYKRHEEPFKSRSAFSMKIRWDGKRSTFESYKDLIEAWLLQAGAGYLINPDFLAKYNTYGTDYFLSTEFWDLYGINVRQADYDRKYLFGILKATNRGREDQFLEKFKLSQDGIKTWQGFQKVYSQMTGGAKDLKLEQLEDAISVKYHSQDISHMIEYLDNFEKQMQQIDTLTEGTGYSEMQKRRKLISNLGETPAIAHLLQYVRDNSLSFEDTTEYLRHNIPRTPGGATKGSSSRKGKGGAQATFNVTSSPGNEEEETQDFLNVEDTTALINHMASETSFTHVYNALSSPSLRQKLLIPKAIWVRLEPELRKKIEEIRKDIESSNGGDIKEGTNKKSSTPTPVPNQYPSMAGKEHSTTALLNQMAELSVEDCAFDDDDEDVDTDHIANLFQVTSSPDLEVRAHLEYARILTSVQNSTYAISDGGADSCVLGKHAHVINETGRHATLIGYDPRTTRSKRIPIVSAYLKVKAHNDIPVFLKVNEAPYHIDNPITLLSEYQIRDFGMVIDSVATKHRISTENSYGTQRFTLSKHVHIPFEDRGGIMGFEILPITEDDFIDKVEPIYDVFEITNGNVPWTPARFRGQTPQIEPQLLDESSSFTPLVPETSVFSSLSEDLYFYDPLDAKTDPALEHLIPADIHFDVNHVLMSKAPDDPTSDHLSDEVNVFLAHLSYDRLTGKDTGEKAPPEYPDLGDIESSFAMFNTTYDSYAYATASWHRVIHDQIDPADLRPYLGYRPLDIIKKTLEHSTQMAKMIIRYPMRRHFKNRSPYFRVKHLDEGYSTDPIFANCASLHHGYTGAQIFMGLKSGRLDAHGFKKPRNFAKIYKEQIRQNGAPSLLRRDNAKDEQSDEVQEIHRELYIKDGFSEPYHPNQNPVEGKGIRWLKDASHVLMDRTGAPDAAWYFAVKYLCDIHAITYDPKLGMSPEQKRRGVTPDISAYLQFKFWEPILYLDHEGSWPSSKERPGYWVGVAKNVGDNLTYWIFDDQMKRLLARSVVRPATHNKRIKWDPSFAPSDTMENTHTANRIPTKDIMPSKKVRDQLLANSMDDYDRAEPEPKTHTPESIRNKPNTRSQTAKKMAHKEPPDPILKPPSQHMTEKLESYIDPGFDISDGPSIPLTKGDHYSGSSRLRFGYQEIPIDPHIVTPTILKKVPSSDVSYKGGKALKPSSSPKEDPLQTEVPDPPSEDKPTDAQREGSTPATTTVEERGGNQDKKNDENKKNPLPRRSSRLRTNWKPALARPIFTLMALAATSWFLPSHLYAEPGISVLPEGHTLGTAGLLDDFKPLDSSPPLEELRAYHISLDRIYDLMYPDWSSGDWEIKRIERHLTRERADGSKPIYVKLRWQDDTAGYLPLDSVRVHDPIVASQYAIKKGLVGKQGWEWIPYYLDKNPVRHAFFTAFKTSVTEGRKFKFGVEVPRSPRHALQLDKLAGTTGWKESIGLELKQLKDYKTFLVVPDGTPLPKGYKRIPYHIVFDVKFDGRKKSRLVAGGHRAPKQPKDDIFSSVVTMEAVRMGFLLAEMQDLLVCAGDVGNAFLYGKTKEKVYIIAGPEFGPELEGKRLIIDRSIYGLSSSSARFHENLSVKMRKMGFLPSKADPDLWIKRLKDGTYEYVARYVDDVIAFSKNPMAIMEELKKHYVMKGVGKPQYYLGGDVVDLPEEWKTENISTAFSAKTYIRNCIPKLASMIGKERFKKYSTPFSDVYHPELDTSDLCDAARTSMYKSLIGSANWIVTLGRFDIAYAVSTLSRYCMAPREGHFQAMERVMGYLAQYDGGKLIVDTKEAPIRSKATFNLGHNWIEFYPDACEELPYDMPVPHGPKAQLTCYVDADHARDKVTCRSVTGIVLLINNTPIYWMSKRQKTVETSTYGSELVAARIAVDLLIEMRYKIRMLGVPLEDTSVMVGDNMSVVVNTTLPSSSLKKKHLACAYHRVKEAIAAGFISFGHIPTQLNLADICTKPLPSASFHGLLANYMFRRPKYIDEIKDKSTDPVHMPAIVAAGLSVLEA